jgi:uncharacterized repeat protein (TIGR01451 family)
MEFRFKDAFIDSVSPALDVEFDESSGITTLSTQLSSKETLPLVGIDYSYTPPTISLRREFSMTAIASPGIDVEVTLQAENIGVKAATNLTIQEVEWWDAAHFELVEGNTTQYFATLNPQSTKSMEYTLCSVYEGEPLPIHVPQATVTSLSSELGENVTYSARSNSQILWIGTETAPHLEVDVGSITNFNPDSTEEITYEITVTNTGSAIAENLFINESPEGALEPESSAAETVTAAIENDTAISVILMAHVTFEYDDQTYSLSGQRMSIVFRPTASYTPAVEIERTLQESSNCDNILTVETSIEGRGNAAMDSIILQNTLPEGTTFVNGSQEVSYDPALHEVAASFTNVGKDDQVTVEWNLQIPAGGVFVPSGIVTVRRGTEGRVYHTPTTAVAGGIALSAEVQTEETALGVNVSISVTLENGGIFSLYDFELQIPGATQGEVVPSNETASLQGGELETGNAMDFLLVFIPGEEGLSTLSGGSVSGLAGGTAFEVAVDTFTIEVFRGLSFDIESTATTDEDEEFTVTMTLSSDIPDRVSDIQVTLNVAPGLEVVSAPIGINTTLSSLSPTGTVELDIAALANDPGSYDLTVSEIMYHFDESPLEYFEVTGQPERIVEIRVRENLAVRYGVYVAGGLALVIAASFYVRLSRPRES